MGIKKILTNIFSIKYDTDFIVVLKILGINIKSRDLYNLLFGNPLITNCDIYKLDELIKKNTYFPHPIGIVIAYGANIGKNCMIMQNVTIGLGKIGVGGFPTIGNNVIISSGAAIIGEVTIGDNVIIGANSVVTKDIPSNTVAFGNPAKVIRPINDIERKWLLREN